MMIRNILSKWGQVPDKQNLKKCLGYPGQIFTPLLRIPPFHRKANKRVMKKFIFFGLTITGLYLSSCGKSNYDKMLPPATQNGSNTMGAYIDNVIWNPAHTGFGTGISADIEGNTFFFRGIRYNATVKEGRTSISLQIINYTGTGSYPLANGFPEKGAILTGLSNAASVSIGNDSPVIYATDSLRKGTVTVTYFDPVKKIISGTFSFDAANLNNPSDIIHITGGRFDFAYPAQTIDVVSW